MLPIAVSFHCLSQISTHGIDCVRGFYFKNVSRLAYLLVARVGVLARAVARSFSLEAVCALVLNDRDHGLVGQPGGPSRPPAHAPRRPRLTPRNRQARARL
eukprot:5279568-Pleurochrysis_carterae.AAC.2